MTIHEPDAEAIFTSSTNRATTSASDMKQQPMQTKTVSIRKGGRFHFLFPYVVGFFSGLIVAYLITILVGYIITKSTDSGSTLRTAFYGYLVGCQSV